MNYQAEQNLGPWNELKARALHYWSKLNEQDFETFEGGLLDMKKKIRSIYGYSAPQLENDFAQFLNFADQESRSTALRQNSPFNQ